jgi:pimeloyl-ACP methyl ester carboxylesterase
MSRPRLLLVPPFSELQWVIRDSLDDWADTASFDPPGVGDEPLPEGFKLDPERPGILAEWRRMTVERGLREVDRRGWERFVVVTDGDGGPVAVRLATERADSVQGLAIGHAALSRAMDGDRAALNRQVWEALGQLMKQDSESFVRYGIAQLTQGSLDDELAARMLERFPDMEIVAGLWNLLGQDPEPMEHELRALHERGIPFLLAKHEGCLGSTDEGYEDIVAAFPDARTVSCPEACEVSPAFAAALHEFCTEIGA